jgi:hypothetical protein
VSSRGLRAPLKYGAGSLAEGRRRT